MSKQAQSKRLTARKNETVVEGWCLYNGLLEEYLFIKDPPDTLMTGSVFELKKARLIIYHNH